jgi:HK97 family phage prohead protease
MELELRSYPLMEVRMEPDAEGRPVLVGHAAVFNQWSRTIPWGGPRGKFRERILPGAFDRTLEAAPDVKLKVDHAGLPLGRTTSGTLTLTPDGDGLLIRSPLDPRDPDVQRIQYKIERGDLKEMSFAFWVPEGGDQWDTSGEMDERTLTMIDLDGGDVSVVADPAYPQTDVALRSLTKFLAEGRGSEPPDAAEGQVPLEVLRLGLDLEEVGIF